MSTASAELVEPVTRRAARRSSPIVLAAGGYRAEVSTLGAALVELTFAGRHLVRSIASTVPAPRFRGAVLAPWPNRIRDGRYTYDGRPQRLPVTEPERGCALHGLLLWHSWTVAYRSPRELVLIDTIWPQPGYPYRVEVTAYYRLDATAGLRIVVTARNDGADLAPFGTSVHPYLMPGSGTVDDWTLTLPAGSVVLTDGRLLPRDTVAVDGTGFDYRCGRALCGAVLDHAFGQIGFDEDGRARATLVAADGAGVAMDWDTACPWVQVHTTDHADPAVHRTGLALEPMTCPPDAFNSGIDLWHLAPGQERSAGWNLSAVTG